MPVDMRTEIAETVPVLAGSGALIGRQPRLESDDPAVAVKPHLEVRFDRGHGHQTENFQNGSGLHLTGTPNLSAAQSTRASSGKSATLNRRRRHILTDDADSVFRLVQDALAQAACQSVRRLGAGVQHVTAIRMVIAEGAALFKRQRHDLRLTRSSDTTFLARCIASRVASLSPSVYRNRMLPGTFSQSAIAPGAMASSGVVTQGNESYSTETRSAASRASWAVSAIRMATRSPTWRTTRSARIERSMRQLGGAE